MENRRPPTAQQEQPHATATRHGHSQSLAHDPPASQQAGEPNQAYDPPPWEQPAPQHWPDMTQQAPQHQQPPHHEQTTQQHTASRNSTTAKQPTATAGGARGGTAPTHDQASSNQPEAAGGPQAQSACARARRRPAGAGLGGPRGQAPLPRGGWRSKNAGETLQGSSPAVLQAKRLGQARPPTLEGLRSRSGLNRRGQ